MKLDLVPGRLLRRYKRFFADVRLDDGRLVVAHCPNTGSMRTLLNPQAKAWLRHDQAPHRKLAWTLTLLGVPGGGLALVDTALPNRIVEEGVKGRRIVELEGYQRLRREVPYGRQKSRIDLILEEPQPGNGHAGPCYVEIKNNTMASLSVEERSDFPDSPTARGLRHLQELTDLARRGVRAVQFYLVARTDCQSAGIASGIDPDYAHGVRRALGAGVEFIAYRAEVRRDRITVGKRCRFFPPDTNRKRAIR